MRGRPWLSSIIVPMHELNQFNDAELVRKKTAAMFGGFIKEAPNLMPGGSVLGKREDDDQEREIVALEPGTFPILPPGMDVVFSTPADVGGSYEQFVKHQERRVAKGFGNLTYEKFTGDLSEVNYSSIRAGNLDYQRVCTMVINMVLAHQFCRTVTREWLNVAVVSGALEIADFYENRRRYYRVRWCGDGWAWQDPLKEVNAENAAIRAGLKSRAESIAEKGRDIEDVDAEIDEDNRRASGCGILLDSNPADDKGRTATATTTEEPVNGRTEESDYDDKD